MKSGIDVLTFAAEAVARSVLRKASLQHHKIAARAVPWNGLCEADVVGCIASFFEGCGYSTWREEYYFENSSEKMDLWAKNPSPELGPAAWCVDAKVLWDGQDNRLKRRRFVENEEVLKDFRHLAGCSWEGVRRAVFWVVFGRSQKLDRSETEASLGIPDACELVEKTFEEWTLAGSACANVSEVVSVKDFPYVHVLVWRHRDG